jgi:tRNA A-37 threonylcarbamoyl transferase component Bud32
VVSPVPPAANQGSSPTQPSSAAHRSTEAPTVALAAKRPTDEAEGELRALLRRRLLVFISLGVWGLGSYVVGRLLDLSAVWANESQRILFPLTMAVLLVSGVALGVLIFRRSLGVLGLRTIELVALVAGCVQAALVTFDPIPDFLLRPEATTFGANNDIFLWFIIITLYGVLIPNTLRRAALVTGTVTAVAAASMLLAWSRYQLPGSMWTLWLTNLIVFLGVAAGMTVFNSARLDSYRRAAAVARELGQYRLGRRLGGGGMGEVFLAEHRLLKRPCAVKLIRPHLAADALFVKRFAREVQAATRLTHPATVQVYDYGQGKDGTCYYVMEYLPGLTLEEIVRRTGPFPAGRVIHVLRQVCGALGEAHGLGLVHRDVKPGNIMLCRLGGRPDAAKLLDFGLVVDTDRSDTRITQVGGPLGTPAYMSPEQASGTAEVGPASDLYSLGAVAYFLLTGRPPSLGPSLADLLHTEVATPSRPPVARSPIAQPDLEAVILRLLALAASDRYASAADVSLALAACGAAADWTETDATQWWEHAPLAAPEPPP